MSHVRTIGLDLAKTVFQVHGVDDQGKVVLRKQLKRGQMLKFFAKLPVCVVGMEASGGMHYWARELSKLGHEVRAMAPEFVKPYLKGQKNDRNDAEAICEAVQRPSMRFVSAKTPEQQSILHLHHARRLLVGQRVALTNHVRAVLQEYGLVLAPGARAFAQLADLLEDAENGLPVLTRELLSELKQTHDHLLVRIDQLEKALASWHQVDESSQRLETIPGVGRLGATVLSVVVGSGSEFANGRQFAAYLGLVPRQHSSGGKDRLGRISKRGDAYVRSLLIHGARAVIHHIRRRQKLGKPGGNPWVEQLLERRHVNQVAVALANKIARVVWALTVNQTHYRAGTLS